MIFSFDARLKEVDSFSFQNPRTLAENGLADASYLAFFP